MNVTRKGKENIAALHGNALSVGEDAADAIGGNRQFKQVQVGVLSNHGILLAVSSADLKQQKLAKADGILYVIVGNMLARGLPPFVLLGGIHFRHLHLLPLYPKSEKKTNKKTNKTYLFAKNMKKSKKMLNYAKRNTIYRKNK